MPAELLDGLDMLASLARTALDDPGVMIDNDGRTVAGEDYAIDRCDEIINLLNPAELTNANAAAALSMLGRHMAEIAERIGDEEGAAEAIQARLYGWDPDALERDHPRRAAYVHVMTGLDAIDAAIDALTGEEE